MSLQKGYNVILKDTVESGLSRGYQQVYKGLVINILYNVYNTHILIHIYKYIA